MPLKWVSFDTRLVCAGAPPPSDPSPRTPANVQPQLEAPAAIPQTPHARAEVVAEEKGMGGGVGGTGAPCEEQAPFSDPEYFDDFED